MFSVHHFALFCTSICIALSPSFHSAVMAQEEDTAKESSREQRLAKYLDGVKLIGKFTMDGIESDEKTGDGITEEYTISKCEKLPEDDMYRMTARIKYGDIDSELPLSIKILWSGDTPVITLDNFWIPGMGTFGARILIHADRYAGTWQHDAVGGHMFGRIEKLSSEETSEKEKEETGKEETNEEE